MSTSLHGRRVRPAVVVAIAIAVTVLGITVVTGAASTRHATHRQAGSRSSMPADGRREVVWTHIVNGWVGAIAADDDAVAVISGNRQLTLLDAVTGLARWRVDIAGVVNDAPALSPDVAAVVVDGGFAAFARSDGRRLWDVHGDGIGHVAVAGNVAVFALPSGTVVAASAHDASIRWQAQYAGVIRAAPTVAVPAVGGVAAVWLGPESATLRVLDLATGALRWQLALSGGASAPAAAGDRLVVGTGDGHVAAYRWSDGAPVWSVPTSGGFEAEQRPAVTRRPDGTVMSVAVDRDGGAVAVDVESGAVVWKSSLGAGEVVLRGAPVVAGPTVLVAAERRRLSALSAVNGRSVPVPDPGGFVAGVARAGRDGATAVFGVRLAHPGRVEAWRW